MLSYNSAARLSIVERHALLEDDLGLYSVDRGRIHII